jgi:hypothetical protein
MRVGEIRIQSHGRFKAPQRLGITARVQRARRPCNYAPQTIPVYHEQATPAERGGSGASIMVSEAQKAADSELVNSAHAFEHQ